MEQADQILRVYPVCCGDGELRFIEMFDEAYLTVGIGGGASNTKH